MDVQLDSQASSVSGKAFPIPSHPSPVHGTLQIENYANEPSRQREAGIVGYLPAQRYRTVRNVVGHENLPATAGIVRIAGET